MCIVICTKCRCACGTDNEIRMPDEIKNGGVGQQLVWLATQATEDTYMTCLNPSCENYLKRD